MVCARIKFFSVIIVLSLLFGAGLVDPANAAELASLTESGLGITLSSDAGRYSISITPQTGLAGLKHDLTANVFGVDNPPRLVIDIPGFKASAQKSLAIDDALFSALRTGVHADKLRVVFDLRSAAPPQYNISPDAASQALVVQLDFSQAPVIAPPTVVAQPPTTPVKTAPEPAQTAALAAPAPTRMPEQLDAPAPIAPIRVPEQTVDFIPAPAAAPPPQNQDSLLSPEQAEEQLNADISQAMKETLPDAAVGPSATISGIYYQSPKDSTVSSVLIDVAGLNTYSLRQRGANKYELLLKNTQLIGDHLALPQFPPDTFSGFEVILAKTAGRDTIIEIFVDDQVKLSPFLAKGKLWIKTAK